MCAAQLRTYVMSSIHVWTSGKISLLQSFAARATLIARSGSAALNLAWHCSHLQHLTPTGIVLHSVQEKVGTWQTNMKLETIRTRSRRFSTRQQSGNQDPRCFATSVCRNRKPLPKKVRKEVWHLPLLTSRNHPESRAKNQHISKKTTFQPNSWRDQAPNRAPTSCCGCT